VTTQKRKADHLKICTEKDVETGSPGFEDVTLVHNAMPELDYKGIDTSVELFGKKLKMPLIIASMTGGTPEAARINKALAEVAEKKGIGFSVGSIRAMIEDKKLKETYYVRDVAPGAFVFANIGIAQVKKYTPAQIRDAVWTIGADALFVHINAAQEAFQPEGDLDFTGCSAALRKLTLELGYPVIAKEVGNGISRETAMRLKADGVAGIDVGGSGGTNWVYVDSLRGGKEPKDFKSWGIPTAVSVVESKSSGLPIIATGGVRSGLDIAKSISLGASACGIALPFLRTLKKGGRKGVEAYVDSLQDELRMAMFLTGCASIEMMKYSKHVLSGKVLDWITQRG
jgi:isopentenyl-diphosphate delta-isomerase